MSQYLNKEQQERLNRIVDEFTVHSGVKQAGLTIKMDSNIVFLQDVEGKIDIDQIKPEELDKLEEAVFNPEASKDLIECSIYIPGTEEVFRYQNGEVNISHRYAYPQRSFETEIKLEEEVEEELEEESLQLLFQQNIQYQEDLQLQQQADLQPENSTFGTSQNNNKQPNNNQIYLDKEFGYVSTDYYLKGASSFGGEGTERITPSSIYMMGEMGVNWNYVIDKLSDKKEPTQSTPKIPTEPTSESHQEIQNKTIPNQLNNPLSSSPQQQNWENLSLDERLKAIREQYGINQQPSPGEFQQQHFRERSR
ncbi:MAG: hypothetical protein AAGF26_05825 [Cyanobacteria bacterium P01_G01_bin.49]